jgi:hypothetical protein
MDGSDPVSEELLSWTIDNEPPYVVISINAHGEMPKGVEEDTPEETNMNGIIPKIFSIAGEGFEESLMGIIMDMHEHPEYNGKGIDMCMPSMLRRVFYDFYTKNIKKEKPIEIENAFNVAIKEAQNMYQSAGIYQALKEKGGFTLLQNPQYKHYYQLYPNLEELARDDSGRRKRAAAGDDIFSEERIYGVWLVNTNIRILTKLALTAIGDETLKTAAENRISNGKSVSSNNLFLPPRLLESKNMASRRDNKPIGANHWISAIGNVGLSDTEENKEIQTRAETTLTNMWRQKITSLHDIIDILTPFHKKGEERRAGSLRFYMLDVTCRTVTPRLPFHSRTNPVTQATLTDDTRIDPFSRDRVGLGRGGSIHHYHLTKRKNSKYTRKRREPHQKKYTQRCRCRRCRQTRY